MKGRMTNARTVYSINRNLDFPFNSPVPVKTTYAMAFQITQPNEQVSLARHRKRPQKIGPGPGRCTI